jgi:hypothetical protein
MIELRMVADDRGNLQLQMRSRSITISRHGRYYQGEWLDWKSVPIVHDPAQLVDRVEIFDARSSGAKPDVGLTGKQLAELLEYMAASRKHYQDKGMNQLAGDIQSRSFASGVAAGIFECISKIQSVLGQQAEESIDDEFDPDLPY